VDAGPQRTAETEAAKAQRQRLTGIALMTGAVAAFACIDTSAKFLNHHVHAVQVVWARFAVAFLLGFIVYNPWTRPGMLHTLRPGLQIGRSSLLIICTALNVVALKYLQLDQTVSILFATPLMVALFAGPMLGEWVGLRRWIAIGVGFLGVLVVTRPGLGGIHPAALLSFIGTVLYAIYSIWTRVLSRHDSTETTLFYSNIVGVALTTVVLPYFWTTPQNFTVVVAMISVGAFGALGHFLLIAAHRLAPASVLAPFIYSELVWMILLGYAVFGDVPNQWTLVGACIVIASGLYLLYRERRVKPGG
jgi:drug/metabolite transporter (DMT)-like permease